MFIDDAYATVDAFKRIQAAFEQAVRKEIDAGNLSEVDETIHGRHYDTTSLFIEVEGALESYFADDLKHAKRAIDEHEEDESRDYRNQVRGQYMWDTRP